MKRTIDLIGVPFALGGKDHGPSEGPSRLLRNGLRSFLEQLGYVTVYHDVTEISAEPKIFSSSALSSSRIIDCRSVREVKSLAGARVFSAHIAGRLPLVVGGDHSISLGTVPQYLHPLFSRGRRVGLLWLDAHYDAHTGKTSHSHYANGLPLASALGYGARSLGCYYSTGTTRRRKRLRFRPENVLHIGAGESDCEPEELALLDRLQVKTVTMADIHHESFSLCMDTLDIFLSKMDDVIFSFDLDAMHKNYAPGVSFQSSDGLFPWQAFKIADAIAKSGKLRQVEIMEYNPEAEERTSPEGKRTSDFIFLFLERIFGQHT